MEVIESVNTHQLVETCSYTRPDDQVRLREHSFTHRWIIEDFSAMLADTSSEYPKFKSAPFSTPVNSAIQFIIDLRPKGRKEDCKNYLSIFLELVSPQENDILVHCYFSLIDSKGVKHEKTPSTKPDIYSSKHSSWGYGKFVLRSYLLNPRNDLLNKDRLIILCEVTIFDGLFTVDTGKYRPSTEEVRVLSKKQTLMDVNCVLECDKQTDVTVVVGNGAKEIRAHKFVLVGASSVFEEMFENDPTEDVVSLSDVSVQVGELFIRYFYSGKVNQLETYAEELFVVADKYGIDQLKRMCVHALCSHITIDSVFQLLIFADRHSSTELLHVCIEYITNHAIEVIRTDHWQMLNDQLRVELFCKLANKLCIYSKSIMDADSVAECDSDSFDRLLSSTLKISKMEATESVKMQQLNETSSYTYPSKYTFSHRWTIENFSVMLANSSSKYPMFKSASFSSPVNSAIQFIIDLRPKGENEDSKDYLSIFLEIASPRENDILVHRSFCLIDSKGEKYGKTASTKSVIYSSRYRSRIESRKFLLRSDLLDPANDLLNEDRLIIHCEVTVFQCPFTVDISKNRPNIEKVIVLSKRQTLMNLNCVLEYDKQTDVTVVVGNGANSKEIRAHKFVLVGGSSVFEAMFKYDTTEKQSGVVSMPDVSAEVGELFIRYLYTGKVNQLETYAEELLVVADKYDIDLLKRMCVQCLCSQMSTSSVCQLLLLSDRHSSTELQQFCIEYITNHANEVIRNEDWQMMSQLNAQLKVHLFCKLVKIYSYFNDCLVPSAPQISEIEATDNFTNHQLEETFSNTRFVKHSFCHRWTIEDFSVMLGDTRSDREDSKDCLSIFLRRVSPTENNILAGFLIYLIDSEGVKRIRRTCETHMFPSLSAKPWGWDKYLQRTDLLDPLKKLLNEDRLIIYCEVTLYDGTFTVDTGKYMPSIEELKGLSKKQTLMDLTSLLECDKQTDVTVVVGGADGAKEIRAHKFVLVGASSVFEEMFENDSTEDVVSLSDVSVEGGELFIRYLYTGNVAQLETYAEELLVLADKYNIDLLKRMCVQCLCRQMSTSSVCQLLLLSDRHSSTELQQSCIEYIINHTNEVIRNEDWQMMSQLNDQLKVALFCKLANKPCIVSKSIMLADSEVERDSGSSDSLLSSTPKIFKMEATESVNIQQLNETSSYTRPSNYTFSHRWTIEDFSVMLSDKSSKYPKFKSAPFSSGVNSEIQFAIDIYPKGDKEKFKDYLAIYLSSPGSNILVVRYSISLIDSKGMKCEGMSETALFEDCGDFWGWEDFLLRSELLDPANDLLIEDRLTILCEVTLFDGAFTVDTGKYMPSLEEVKVLSKKQTLMNLISLLECDKQTDVTVVVGNGAKEIIAHKFVLVGDSSVYEAMFKYDTSEKQSGVVTLTDVSIEVGELFIRYLYTGKVNQLETYAEELFVFADMYDIYLLKRMCIQFLSSQITTESVFKLLLFADRHSSTELQQVCIEYITNHSREVILTEDWQIILQLNDQLKLNLFHKLANKH